MIKILSLLCTSLQTEVDENNLKLVSNTNCAFSTDGRIITLIVQIFKSSKGFSMHEGLL